jgi:hypothetical protein
MQFVKICFEKIAKLKSFIADSVSKQRKLERQACRNGNARRADVAAIQMQRGKEEKLPQDLLMNIIPRDGRISHTALHRSRRYSIGEMAAQTRNLCDGCRSIANPTVL